MTLKSKATVNIPKIIGMIIINNPIIKYLISFSFLNFFMNSIACK
ncbi:hypothetical protein BN173_1670007 [Clostridioides difficile T11]|nr:hypothetical protein BN173_1670007 [Clostridioides difficile T11]CCL29873.1 hypothetical protein BN174_1570007 [Clostridioides difficile E15]